MRKLRLEEYPGKVGWAAGELPGYGHFSDGLPPNRT